MGRRGCSLLFFCSSGASNRHQRLRAFGIILHRCCTGIFTDQPVYGRPADYLYDDGGARPGRLHQQLQLMIVSRHLFAAYLVVHMLPEVSWFYRCPWRIGEKLGKPQRHYHRHFFQRIELSDQYNLLSGIIGGFFLALSYFRCRLEPGRAISLPGRSARTGVADERHCQKVPMQFLIPLVGVPVRLLLPVQQCPLVFNDVELRKLDHSMYRDSPGWLANDLIRLHFEKKKSRCRFRQRHRRS